MTIYVAFSRFSNNPVAPTWLVVAVWVGIFVLFFRVATKAERTRKVENQPHTTIDSALLLVAALIVVALVLCIVFLTQWRLHPTEWHFAIYAAVLIVGGSLTYLFNRNAKHRE